MQASSPARAVFKLHRGGMLFRSGALPIAARLLNRVGVGLMGWLTIFLVTLGVAGLVGVTWVHIGRR